MTSQSSRSISSNQSSIHDRLKNIVERHLDSRFRRPYADHNLRAFEQAQQIRLFHHGPIILDSFCGVGESTANIARQFPEALVFGIDKSKHRLQKHAEHYADSELSNYYLLQADVEDFWRLAVDAGWQLFRHYVLYPNPWPKSAQLKRRVHGSAVFPALLELGGALELRSNWHIYVEEFNEALRIAGQAGQAEPYLPERPITPFERKYQSSGQPLWRCICQLNSQIA